MSRIFFHTDHTVAASGYQFDTDTARACKQVKCSYSFFEINIIIKYIEQILLGEIGRRPRPQVAGRVDGPALVFSAYYSHTICLKYPPSFRFNAQPSPLPMRSV